jgi:hypothetical protein
MLMEINRTLGRIEQKIDGNAQALRDHVSNDEKTHKFFFDQITPLQTAANKQKGFMSALAIFGSLIGAGIGYVVERLIRGG